MVLKPTKPEHIGYTFASANGAPVGEDVYTAGLVLRDDLWAIIPGESATIGEALVDGLSEAAKHIATVRYVVVMLTTSGSVAAKTVRSVRVG